VALIATVHGETLPEIINCEERGSLIGGCATVTLSGHEAERRFDKRKQVQKRARDTVFKAALELQHRSQWIFHENVKDAVDVYLEGEPCNAQELRPGKAVAVASIPGEGCLRTAPSVAWDKRASITEEATCMELRVMWHILMCHHQAAIAIL